MKSYYLRMVQERKGWKLVAKWLIASREDGGVVFATESKSEAEAELDRLNRGE